MKRRLFPWVIRMHSGISQIDHTSLYGMCQYVLLGDHSLVTPHLARRYRHTSYSEVVELVHCFRKNECKYHLTQFGMQWIDLLQLPQVCV